MQNQSSKISVEQLMKKKYTQYAMFLSMLFLTFKGNATSLLQVNREPEMANLFYSEGKIWVVIAVFSIAVLGIGIYLFSMDKRISKIESISNKHKD